MSDPRLPELDSEELARRLDEVISGNKSRLRRQQQSDDPRIAAAQMLANNRHPAMSPEMSARIQAKMLAAHRQKTGRQRTSRPPITMVYRWASVVAAAVAIFSAASIPAMAGSVPGEFLYPVKRNVENIELLIAASPSSRAEVHLIQAERRINEVQVLLQRQIFDANLMIDARNSLFSYEQAAEEDGIILSSDEARAAGVTESIALLLQEAEQMELVSGDQVVALIPTVIAIPTMPENTVAPPTVTPSPTQTMTALPTATVPPSATAPIVVVEPTTEVPALQPSPTKVPPSPTATSTDTATPIPSNTPTQSSTPQPAMTATLQQPTATMYALENTNVRSQPARNQPIIAVIQQGKAVEVTGEDDTGKWWHVRLSDGRSGWVARFLLSSDKPVIETVTGDENGNSGSSDSSNGGDFGCEYPGNYCNAPGQNGTQPTPSNGNSNGNGNGDNNGNGQPSNPGGGGPPANPGGGHKP